MKSASYNIGAWVIDHDDKIVKITHDDMPDLTYEQIKRDCTPEEIPEFEVEIEDGHNLNKDNFFHKLQERCPIACDLFCKWVDEFKKIEFPVADHKRHMNWDLLFGNHFPTAQKIKFHDIPFEMQFGILVDFFSDKNGYCGFSIVIDNWQERDTVIAWIIDMFVFLEVAERNAHK